MRIVYPDRASFEQTLRGMSDRSVDFALVTTVLDLGNIEGLKRILDECARVLKDGGLLFVHGCPEYLPTPGVYLDQLLEFKYWIAVESAPRYDRATIKIPGLPSVHAAVLLFAKGNNRFTIQQVRFPHEYCAFCHRTLKDWGGKAHLMNPAGYAISDVWKALPKTDNYTRLSRPVLETILRMVGEEAQGVVGPKEGIVGDLATAEPPLQYRLPGFGSQVRCRSESNETDAGLFNVVHHGDAVEVLKRYPDNSIDLVFADPPYNLDKAYHTYEDERADEEYIKWCNAWLEEYVRILKPTGSLYVLNLPRWAMYHAEFLNRQLYFQNWIVWDALSEPRGKLMPAHYGLLFYTKHPTDFTFNYDEVGRIDARYYCLRASCIRRRKALGQDDKEPLTDFWWDIHRIKHKRDRDYHPCQLPEALMERIIRLSTNEGDIVLDALCGTGTTLVTAARLGRRYVGIDIDEHYVQLTREKLAEVEHNGYVVRESIHRPPRPYTKKELQLELRALAAQLGRLPTPEDVRRMSRYDVEVFFEMFPTWGKALKAAKLEVSS